MKCAGQKSRAWPCTKNRGRFARVRTMPQKKKSRVRIHKEARWRARLGVGLPPPEKILPNKREKPPKHKKTFSQLLED